MHFNDFPKCFPLTSANFQYNFHFFSVEPLKNLFDRMKFIVVKSFDRIPKLSFIEFPK